MKIYKSCRSLPIQRFYDIFSSDDYRLMIQGFDIENDLLKLTKIQKIELEDIFKDIYYKFAEITENHKLKSLLKQHFLIEKWEFIYKAIVNIMFLYTQNNDTEFLKSINRLEEVSYQFDLDKELIPQLEKMTIKMKGLKMKISLFKLKLRKKKKTQLKREVVDLAGEALFLERHLDLNRSIDPNTTSIVEWVNLSRMSKEKTKFDKTQK